MKGLELSELYFQQYGLPMIKEKFPTYHNRIASGLVGDGSECFGFDDEISRDHDWGPAFCLWLTKPDFRAIGTELQQEINKIPKTFMGYEARNTSKYGHGRIGVMEITQFYKSFIGHNRTPESLMEWRRIPENNLAAATNGKIFIDDLGQFTHFRNQLLQFYPNDIRLKKIAARCMTIAKTGQYNYLRCMRRGENVAAQHAQMQFVEATISLVFLLNKKYVPFYKWMHRSLKDLDILGIYIYDLINELCAFNYTEGYGRNIEIIERICQLIIAELHNQNLSHSTSDFLLDHGPQVFSKIQDTEIRQIPILID